MYLRDLWESCLRRWYLVLVCLALTAGITVLAASQVKPTYEAHASVILVPPGGEGPATNPYLGLAGLQQSADVLARSLASAETTDAIHRKSPDGEYKVELDPTSSAPMLAVTAGGAEPKDAARMLDVVLRRIPTNLRILQAQLNIALPNQITTQLVAQDARPQAVQKTRIRVLGALAAALLLVSAIAVAAVDGMLLGRRRRRGSQAWDAAPDDEDLKHAPRRSDEREQAAGSALSSHDEALGVSTTTSQTPRRGS